MKQFEKLFPYFLFAGILINANGLINDILEPDGALYATISKHIVLKNDWVNLIGNGSDWLDKPHFHFWISAISFKLFGITPFAYKFPAFVFWLAGTFFTYKLTEEIYDSYTAKIAVIMYTFSLHGILNNFDVRAEPYLTALSIGAIYFFYKTTVSNKWYYLILTAVLAACAVMTKGIFVLLTIGGGFIVYWIISKQWKQFVNYRWWLLLVLILLFITPELYCLYVQFDLHPEKVVFEKTNVSGLKFFFWDSQFGRFFNTGPIRGNGDKTFFLHTTLWAFLPWSILLYVAVFKLIKNRKTETPGIKWIIYGSAILTFILFSLSGFQLPHYIVILFPQFAIISADYLAKIQTERTFKNISVLQTTLLIMALAAICLLAFFSKLANGILVSVISVPLVVVAMLSIKKYGTTKIMTLGASFSFVLFLFLHNFFYPKLMEYQAGMEAGKWLAQQKDSLAPVMFRSFSYSFEFYAPGFIKSIGNFNDLDNFLKTSSNGAIFTSEESLPELTSHGYYYNILKDFPYFHVSMLTGKFLNSHTRASQLERMVLVTVQKRRI